MVQITRKAVLGFTTLAFQLVFVRTQTGPAPAAAPPGVSQPATEQPWPFGTIKKPIDFKGAYYAPEGQACRLQVVFKKDLLDTTLSYSIIGFYKDNTNMTFTHLAPENANAQLSYVSPDAGIGLRGAYALKGSGSTEADEKYEGYGLQPIEIASACNNAQPPVQFRIHAVGKDGIKWDSAPFNISSHSLPPPVKKPGGGRSTPLATQAFVYWDDVDGTGVKPQGSFILSADPDMLAKKVIDSHFVVSVNHTDIPVQKNVRSRVEVVRFNLDGNGALSPTLDAAFATV